MGGGLTGLWAGLPALEREPSRSVTVVEGDRIASNASGRNGGFCATCLTHGDPNGRARWPQEMPQLRILGDQNLKDIENSISNYGIDCDFESTGQLDVAIAECQAKDLREEYEVLKGCNQNPILLEGSDLEKEIRSPIVLAGPLDPTGQAMLNPARLAWGNWKCFRIPRRETL